MKQISALEPKRTYEVRKINKEAWRDALPHLKGDKQFEQFLTDYELGVDIGVKSEMPPARARRRAPIDTESAIKFAEKIIKWHAKGHLLGPFKEGEVEVQDIREAPVFTVNKPDGGKRPVSDASARLDDGGPSVNEMIKGETPEVATVTYLQIQQMIAIIMLLGPSSMMWAKDLQEGYYNLRVKESQIRLTAFIFFGVIFIPMTLQMGLSSAPYLFTVFMWYVVQAMLTEDEQLTHLVITQEEFEPYKQYFPENSYKMTEDNKVSIDLIVYYLDDMFGFHHKQYIWRQYRMAQRVLRKLDLNAQEKKDRKPLANQLALGLLFDCKEYCIRIPPEKGQKYMDFADKLLSRKTVTKRELFSLTGKTRHLAIHIPVLSAFARGVEIYGFQSRKGKMLRWSSKINMCSTLKLAVTILRRAIERAMEVRVPFIRVLRRKALWTSEYEIYTDAAGRHGGIGGFIAGAHATYYQVHWHQARAAEHHDIHWKEMIAIYVMLQLIKEEMRGKYITVWCDNKPVVGMLIGYKAKITRPDLMWIICQIADTCLEYDINPWWDWIEGDKNVTADNLSRFKRNPFKESKSKPGEARNVQALQHLNTAIEATKTMTVDRRDCVFDEHK